MSTICFLLWRDASFFLCELYTCDTYFSLQHSQYDGKYAWTRAVDFATIRDVCRPVFWLINNVHSYQFHKCASCRGWSFHVCVPRATDECAPA